MVDENSVEVRGDSYRIIMWNEMDWNDSRWPRVSIGKARKKIIGKGLEMTDCHGVPWIKLQFRQISFQNVLSPTVVLEAPQLIEFQSAPVYMSKSYLICLFIYIYIFFMVILYIDINKWYDIFCTVRANLQESHPVAHRNAPRDRETKDRKAANITALNSFSWMEPRYLRGLALGKKRQKMGL